MKTLNIPKIREEHNAIKIGTILCFVLAAICLILYLSNLGIGVSGAPAEFEKAMVNIHNLLVLGPKLCCVFRNSSTRRIV
jgi:hypothetical protein